MEWPKLHNNNTWMAQFAKLKLGEPKIKQSQYIWVTQFAQLNEETKIIRSQYLDNPNSFFLLLLFRIMLRWNKYEYFAPDYLFC